MKSSAVKLWLTLLLVLLTGYGVFTCWKVYRAMAETPLSGSPSDGPAALTVQAETPPLGWQVGSFELIDRQGEPFSSKELEGKVWVASFFFASCPGACLKMNDAIARMQADTAGPPVPFVSITVDPENDTPDVLDRYAGHYGAQPDRWRFLTGPTEDVRRLAVDGFKVSFGKASHSDRLLVVDRQGRVQGAYSAMDDAQLVLLKRKLDELRQEPADDVGG